MSQKNTGKITQIIGPVMDIVFPIGKLPSIYNALTVTGTNEAGQSIQVTCEVQLLLSDKRVRAISMTATDGLMRGMDVIDTGSALNVPVGRTTLRRIFNVLGEPVDELGSVDTTETLPIHLHRPVPRFVDLDTNLPIFETEIKVVDLRSSAFYRRGGKIGLFSGVALVALGDFSCLGASAAPSPGNATLPPAVVNV